MAINGPTSKSDESRERRNAPSFATDHLVWDGVLHGPVPNKEWCADTKRWWRVWRTSDQSMVMTETDWEFMLETAMIHNRLHSSTNLSHTAFGNLMAELRQRIIQFGGTYESRKKLHLEVATPQSKLEAEMADPVGAAQAATAVDYEAMLTKTDE